MINVDYPYHFDGRERTAEADDSRHIRNLIEQLLFTQPGERVNRLGNRITVERVETSADDSTLRVSIDYVVTRTGDRRTADFERATAG